MYKFIKSGNNCNRIKFKEDFMRRDFRKNNQNSDLNEKIIKYAIIGVSILAVIVLGLLIYSKSLNDRVKDETLSSEQLSSILNNVNSNTNTQSASTEIGKSVNEAKNEMKNESKNTTNTANTVNNTNKNILNTNSVNTTNVTTSAQTTQTQPNKKEETEKTAVELKFSNPVDGEIVRDFAVDSLIYSETLQEWTTHTGIDIKADKTTVVKSAEAGTVKSIKNDPRYGMTIVIEHENGFKTVYSNLLTSEFVVEGEKVEKGQSLGTVGNTAAFEIADEPHLHFEILKDNVAVDPNIYLK
jgi:murein DD-endopeptidase MepM/ murein hydrolase activator NlpD